MVDIPIGYCQCGCGQKTSIARSSNSKIRKGQPYRFLHGHAQRVKKYPRQKRLCNFGCGRPVREYIRDGKLKSYNRTCGICKVPLGRSAEERFFQNVKILENGCWLWTGYIREDGYGQFSGKRLMYVHLWAYKHFNGEIPNGHELHHRCENHACANPDHLEPLTKPDHLAKGNSPPAQNKRKVFCIRGHSLINAPVDRHGWRICKVCQRIYPLKRKEAVL